MLRWPFRKKRPVSPSGDDLTLRLLQGDWRCSCCGEMHRGLMDLGTMAPDPWPEDRIHEPNSALRLDGDFLSEDFCVLQGEHFMVRCVLEIPVHGLAEPWGFGCWSSLSRENFERYVATFDDGDCDGEGPWFGWLCNHLAGYFEEGSEAVDVCPVPGRQRPRLVVQSKDTTLGRAQHEGITPDAMLAILSAYGHGPTRQ